MRQGTQGIFLDEGNVRMAWIEPEFREFLRLMNRWVDMGLLNTNNMFNMSRQIWDQMVLTGELGATLGNAGGGIGTWLNAAEGNPDIDPGFNLVAAHYPVFNRGDRISHGHTTFQFAFDSPGHAAITTAARNRGVEEIATRVLDFAYSEEGYILNNFGVEGVTFQWDNGFPRYTDLITNNPDGLSMNEIMSLHMRSMSSGPFVQSPNYVVQFQRLPQQINAIELWGDQDNPASTLMPPVSYSAEETQAIARILGDLNTYRLEMVANFIIGNASLDNDWDAFVENMINMGAHEVIEVHQQAVDRFFAR